MVQTLRVRRTVPDLDELRAIPDPVQRASAADEVMWEWPRLASRAREIRREALREAVDASVPVERIAAALRVRESDVAALLLGPEQLSWLPRQRPGD